LEHHPWNGLRFWDLVQPFFMFIVGVAIPFSVTKRLARGDDYSKLVLHAIQRSVLLFLFGWALYCIGPGKITFRFQNVLTQLSFTYLVAFLLMRRSVYTQLGVSFFFLLLTEIVYRTFWVEGFNQPFVPDKNFGAWFDLLVSGELSNGHWVSINAVPTAAHTIWGVLAGWLIMSDRTPYQKIKIMVLAGIVGLAVGYALDPITPIIKRISTTSFVIASGGCCFLFLALSYWIIDVLKYQRWAVFFAIVGMNPLFIYLFANVGGANLLKKIVVPFSTALFSWAGATTASVITSFIVWGMLWYLCYWLYKNKIFIKI
ncbi:DUF5009 domain-containing protein, partial [bacterium]|nr:DUF5009 domain-containing protein [bacterium]